MSKKLSLLFVGSALSFVVTCVLVFFAFSAEKKDDFSTSHGWLPMEER
jgi:hypothetical protein